MVRDARRYTDPDDYIRREFKQMIEAIKTAPLKIEGADTENCRAIALAHLAEAQRSRIISPKSLPAIFSEWESYLTVKL